MALTAPGTENRAGRPLARSEVMTASEVAELLHPPALTASTSRCAMRSRGAWLEQAGQFLRTGIAALLGAGGRGAEQDRDEDLRTMP